MSASKDSGSLRVRLSARKFVNCIVNSPSRPPESDPVAALKALRERLSAARIADRARHAREIDRLFARRQHDVEFERRLAALQSAIEASAARVEALRGLPLKLDCNAELPIAAHRDELLTALEKHRVVVVCGATGSGKTTQLPKLCLEAGRGALGMIGHTQPRRIAARALAARLASELGTFVGGAVGYQVRFNDRTGPDCRVKLMTDGILLKELEGDRDLRRYDTIILDEAHERSLNIDLLLGVLRRLVERRPDLKVIVTSATIDPEKFSRFFDGAPVIEVSGRSYPVEVRYRPLHGEDEEAEALSLPEGIVAAVQELDRESRGDVLVFLPGEKQIREAADALGKARLRGTEILPLYSRLSTREQERIFEPHGERRVVLSTNVAETSLTVPGIAYVIDSGLARISRYSVRGKVQRLPIEPIARASADQRKGRCGREREGICIRLFGEEEFGNRDEFTAPEVLRTNLASVILQLAVSGLGTPESFPFIDPPDTRLVNDGYRLLQELKAVDEERRVTSVGRQIAALPVDPRLARMLLAASHHSCLSEMLIIAAFLSVQDPRERPAEAQQQADAQHAAIADPRSDFVTILNLWKQFGEQAEALSGNQLRKWCRERFLSFMRMREWQELHAQLSDTASDIELRPNQLPADYADLHQSILTGFLGSIGQLEENREYLGARGTRFVVAPGTPLAGKPPKWIVAGSLVETTRLYARMVAAIEPAWIEAAGAHLLKRSYAEPHWVEERGFVAAFESVSLYGLTLASRRRVNYGSVAPREAREIFVREALVEGRARLRADFLERNRRLRADVEGIEARIRRRDVLVDEQALVDFYLARLPEQVHSVAALQQWLRSASPQTLIMTQADLMRRAVPEATVENFPDSLEIAGNRLPLSYRFEPSQGDDGITLTVPEPLLSALDEGRLAWLVPGLRMEKITALLRALPKQLRKAFVPVPEHAGQALQSLHPTSDFFGELAAWITRRGGQAISAGELAALPLPEHLRFNIRVTDLEGRLLSEGRDLQRQRREVRSQSRTPSAHTEPTTFRSWEFGDLPPQREVQRGALRFAVFPALQDGGEAVAVVDAASLVEAESISRRGVLRLAILALPQQFKLIRKGFADRRELTLLGQGMSGQRPLADLLSERVFMECFLPGEKTTPRTRSEFDAMIDQGRDTVVDIAQRMGARAVEILDAARSVRKALAALQSPVFLPATADIGHQLAGLLPEDFLVSIPQPWFDHLPRYLKALARRMERLPGNVKRDSELQAQVEPFSKGLQRLRAGHKGTTRRAELERLRWLIEEFRVSLFAQDLRTSVPVSEKRLREQLARAEAELKGQ